MRIPKALKFGAIDITVRKQSSAEMEVNECIGRFHGAAAIMDIRTDYAPCVTRELLLHEVLHGLCWLNGIATGMEWDKEYEERVVSLVAPALLAVMRDNPRLVGFLMEDTD